MRLLRGIGFTVLSLTVLLGACNIVQAPTSPPPPPPSTTAQLKVSPSIMNGVTTATVNVTAEGAWTLGSDHPGWVALQPSSGSGSTQVAMTVDPSGLQPDSYSIGLTLSAGGATASAHVPFSFPDVTVTVSRGDRLSSQAVEPSAPKTPNPALHAFGAGPGDLVVGVAKVPAQAPALDLAQVRASQGVRVRSAFARAGVVTVHAANVQAAARHLATLPGVRYVEAALPLETFSNDTYRSDQWNLDRLSAEQAWPTGDGTGTTIAILDRGFDTGHPDLSANISGTHDAVGGGSDAMVSDKSCGSHGTHVAGIAAAVANNARGVAGVAPGAGLLLVNIGDASATNCAMTTPTLIDALNYVANGGNPRARVINMSLGTTSDLGQGVRDALSAAQTAGIVLVAAAGNDTTTQPTPVAYPAAYPEVLAVGATTPTNDIAFYSDRGPNLWVVAPGGGTATDRGAASDQILSTWYDWTVSPPADTYAYEEGTSMASPAVAALAAQLLTARPGATPDQIATALADGATDLGPSGFDDTYGYGLANAVASKQALAGLSPLVVETSDGRSFDVTRDVPFTIPNVPTGSVTVRAGTDDNGDGTLGDATGELYGQATVNVAFDAPAPRVDLPVTPQ